MGREALNKNDLSRIAEDEKYRGTTSLQDVFTNILSFTRRSRPAALSHLAKCCNGHYPANFTVQDESRASFRISRAANVGLTAPGSHHLPGSLIRSQRLFPVKDFWSLIAVYLKIILYVWPPANHTQAKFSDRSLIYYKWFWQGEQESL
jgi:hypothetical protein